MKLEAKRRDYRQSARLASTERTRMTILAATRELAGEKLLAAITLKAVAERSGVTVQTVLRRFDSREGLLSAAVQHFLETVARQRRVAAGDTEQAVSVVVDHYEEFGDAMLLILGQEATEPDAAKITAAGRRLHDQWVRETFKPADADQHRLLVIATDLYAWKLLRRDRGLTQVHTEEHLRALCALIMAG
jgi:AcrR family transcriptional regulator